MSPGFFDFIYILTEWQRLVHKPSPGSPAGRTHTGRYQLPVGLHQNNLCLKVDFAE